MWVQRSRNRGKGKGTKRQMELRGGIECDATTTSKIERGQRSRYARESFLKSLREKEEEIREE